MIERVGPANAWWAPQGAAVGAARAHAASLPRCSRDDVLSPAARGTGAGRALVMAALDAARAQPGLTVIQLSAMEGNDRR